MTTTRRERDHNFAEVNNPECIVRDSRQTAAAANAAARVRNPPGAPQKFGAALQEVTATILREYTEEMFDAIADIPVPD